MKDIGLVIPVYANKEYESMVDRCIESIDIDPSRVLLVDNSPQSLCKKYENRGFKIVYYPENVGISKAFNLGLEIGHDWTFLVSCSMRFPEGFSAVAKVLDQSNEEECFFTMQAWHCNAISQKLVKKIGYWDENIYPGYCEDSDYMRRIALAEIVYGGLYDIPAYCQKTSIGMSSGAQTNIIRTANYYEKKWGDSDPNKAIYTLPFQNKPLDYWPKKGEEHGTL